MSSSALADRDPEPQLAAMPDAAAASDVVSAREAAAALGIHERSVRRAIRRGQLAATRRGRTYAISCAAVERFRASLPAPRPRFPRPPPYLHLVPRLVPAGTGLPRTPESAGSRSGEGDGPTGRARAGRRGRSAGLPAPLTPLVGREREVGAVAALLGREGVRLVTLTGPGGVGKTRLGLAVAARFAAEGGAGVVFVSLATVVEPALVMPAVAGALGMREAGGVFDPRQLHRFVRERRLLLVLDNLEQLLPAAPALADLLAACPAVRILATSRAPLRISGEHAFGVPPLALPDPTPPAATGRADDLDEIAAAEAVRLFVARAEAATPGFALTERTAPTVAAICRRLDGLPLAIELAAAWTKVLAPAALLDRLERLLPLLADGPRDRPPRHRAMREAIRWSYDLLQPDERNLFRRLAVFAGGFGLEAAEAMAAPDGQDPLALLTALIDGSLVRRDDPAADLPRFRMLETIREFGSELLVAEGEEAAVALRHAEWCLALVARANACGGSSQVAWLLELERDRANFGRALAWLLGEGRDEAALRLACGLAPFWLRRGHFAEGTLWLQRALTAGDRTPSMARVNALCLYSTLLWPGHDHGRAAALLAQAETVAAALGDPHAAAVVRLHVAYLALLRGDLDQATAIGADALAGLQAAGDWFNRNGALWTLAFAAILRGDLDEAEAAYHRLHDAAGEWDDEVSFVNVEVGRALIAERRGAAPDALRRYAAAARGWWQMGDAWATAGCVEAAAIVAVAAGRAEAGVRLFAAAESGLQLIGAVAPASYARREDRERALAAARAALPAARFDASQQAGARLSVEEAIAGVAALAAAVADGAAGPRRAAPNDVLTPRERDVLRLVVEGRADKEIAAALFITRRSASKHVSALLAKLGVASRAAASALAVRERLV